MCSSRQWWDTAGTQQHLDEVLGGTPGARGERGVSCWAFHIAGPREPCCDRLARCWGAKKNAGHKRQAFVEVPGARASRAWLGAGSTHAMAALVRQSGCAIQAFGVQPCPLCPCPSCLLQLSQSSPSTRGSACTAWVQAPFAVPKSLGFPVPLGSLRTPAFLPAPARGALHACSITAGLPFPTSALPALCLSKTKTPNHPNQRTQGPFHFL